MTIRGYVATRLCLEIFKIKNQHSQVKEPQSIVERLTIILKKLSKKYSYANMTSEHEEKDVYVYLDFKGKVELNNLDNKHFVRVADLHTSNPLVQVDDLLFKGTYEDCIGTNLFFIEEEGVTSTKNCFEKESCISLKYLLSQNKIINLKCVRVKNNEESGPTEPAGFRLNLEDDYATVLKKLGSGTLKIDDIIIEESPEPNSTQEEKTEHNEKVPEQEAVEPMDSEETSVLNAVEDSSQKVDLEKQLDQVPAEEPIKSQNARLLEKYEKLQQLARRPVHREVEPEQVMQCEDRYKKQFEYHNIERQVLQRGDSFPVLDFSADLTVFENAVDVDRCKLYNIIPTLNRKHPEITDTDKRNIYKIENFEFMSLPTRLFVLDNQLEELKTFVKNATENESKKVDEFGRTPQETLEILEKLVTNLKMYLDTIKNIENSV